MGIASLFARRNVLKATAVLGGLSMLSERTSGAQADQPNNDGAIGDRPDEVRMSDIPPSSTAKITVERRGKIVLIGINRPYIHNRCQIASNRDPLSRPIMTPSGCENLGWESCSNLMRMRRCWRNVGRA